VFSRHIRTLSKIGIFAGTLSLTASPRDTVKPYSVYHNGADIVFAPEVAGTRKVASFGHGTWANAWAMTSPWTSA